MEPNKMKPVKQQGFWVACVAVIGLLNAAVLGAAPSREEEINKYVDTFSHKGTLEQQAASEELGWAGLTDPRIFDLMEKNLQAVYKNVSDRAAVNHAAWLCKGLGYSGQEKYRATLQEVADNARSGGLRKYAKEGLDLQPNYKKWNPIMVDTAQFNEAKSAELNRFANMLRSGDKGLQQVAARRIIEQEVKDEWLLDLLQQTVQPDIAKSWSDERDVKTVGYMLKGLAASGNPKYRATVEQAANSAGSSKVQRYAKGYLKSY
jgi:hypothetical protein